ncbi:MAG TPA: porin family protein [Saprospiraceae bacterium]|nr:porin family protein [Saprospiraceae bacterium]
MNKQVIGFLALSFCFLTTFSFAQTGYGIRAGATFNNISQSDVIDAVTPDIDYLVGFSGAFFAEVPIAKGLSFQPELAYSQKGFSIRQDAETELFGIALPIGVRANSRFDYLETPLLLKGKFGNEKVKGFVMAGPALGYAVNGNLRTRSTGFLEIDLFDTSIDLDAINYERFEVSGIVGAGLTVDAGFGNITLDARFQQGFTELYDIPLVAERVKNQGFALNAGVAIPLR